MNAAPTSCKSIRAAFSYCVEQVRSYDYHHYLCLLLLPPPMRKPAFAFRAFNVEIARAMDVASDPSLGLGRLLWWQEAIDNIFSKKLIVEQPVARALSAVIWEHQISKHWLRRSLEARINDANSAIPVATIADLERYAEDTVSTILYMTLQAGGIQSTAADHAASHIGKASGLLLLMKSLPYHAARSVSGTIPYIPAQVAEKHGLVLGCWDQKLSDSVFEVASVAVAHLSKARQLAPNVPPEAVPVLLPAVAVEVLFGSLQRCNFNVFDSRLGRGVLGVSPLYYQFKLKWHSWRSRF